MTEAWKDRVFTNAPPLSLRGDAAVETTIKLNRTAYLSEEDWQRAIREGGTFNLRGGFRVAVTLGVEISDDGWGPPIPMDAEVFISGDRDTDVTTHTEEVTFHPDGSYSRRQA